MLLEYRILKNVLFFFMLERFQLGKASLCWYLADWITVCLNRPLIPFLQEMVHLKCVLLVCFSNALWSCMCAAHVVAWTGVVLHWNRWCIPKFVFIRLSWIWLWCPCMSLGLSDIGLCSEGGSSAGGGATKPGTEVSEGLHLCFVKNARSTRTVSFWIPRVFSEGDTYVLIPRPWRYESVDCLWLDQTEWCCDQVFVVVWTLS